ncbi:monovalent cation/H(+) antiporter subunit G [Segeticoccus rhizosphaerae]|uniref:monovalent cation/H(+) antiporter subunit G n=1 Tax=Segeticoccus rhizosphaerae TaxID=1104777 RepID=UPI0010C0F964|nr:MULTISPECIES: monovalent cation/H(+) antiporter subunit G [Intrasporangiaceae]
MTWAGLADVAGAVALVSGALLCLAAAIGLLRFRDILSRMHAATKPQVLGVLLVLLGVGLRLRDPVDIGMLVLIGLFQLLTVPVSGHMLSRASHRTGLVDHVDGVTSPAPGDLEAIEALERDDGRPDGGTPPES